MADVGNDSAGNVATLDVSSDFSHDKFQMSENPAEPQIRLEQNGGSTTYEKDLVVLVDEPKKHLNAFETYITYRITTRTTRQELEQTDYDVRRRYSDFFWLRQQLVSTYPTHIVPPLPEKHGMKEQMDRYDKDFIDSRMQMLGQFLSRIASHPVLSCDKFFLGFLTASQNDFNTLRKTGPGILDRLSDSLHSMATSYVSKERTFEFERMNDYIVKLADKLHTMEKIGNRIYKERQGYVQELQQMHPCLTEWANSEPGLSDALNAVAGAFATCADAEKGLVENYRSTIGVPLHEYGLYISAAKEALNRRDATQMDYEVHMEHLCRLKTEQTQVQSPQPDHPTPIFGLNMWRSPEEVQQQRLQQLEASIATVSQQVEVCRDKMECANENLRADYERWNRVKAQDLKKILTQMADQHIRMYEECLTAWSNALPTVVRGQKENDS